MRLWFWLEGRSERQPHFHGLPQSSSVRGVCGRSVAAADSRCSCSLLSCLALAGSAGRWRCEVAPVSSSSTFRSQRGPSSLVPLGLTAQRIQRRALVSSMGFLLASSVTPGLQKQEFFFLSLKSRTPPMTDLLLWRSEAQPHRHWAAFVEVFFCILRRLMARC